MTDRFAEDKEKWMRLGKLAMRAHALLIAPGSNLKIIHAIAKAAAELDITLSEDDENRLILALGKVVMSPGGVLEVARKAGVAGSNGDN